MPDYIKARRRLLKIINFVKKSRHIYKGPPKKRWVKRCPDWWVIFNSGHEQLMRGLRVPSKDDSTGTGEFEYQQGICWVQVPLKEIAHCAPIEPDSSNFAWGRVKKPKPFKIPTMQVLSKGIITVTAPCTVKKGERAYCNRHGDLCDSLEPEAFGMAARYEEDGNLGDIVRLNMHMGKPQASTFTSAPLQSEPTAQYGHNFILPQFNHLCPTCKKYHRHSLDDQRFTICKDCWDNPKVGK